MTNDPGQQVIIQRWKKSTPQKFPPKSRMEGEITLTMNPYTEVEPRRRRVQTILNEGIPFFCTKQIAMEVKPKYSRLFTMKGLRREQLL